MQQALKVAERLERLNDFRDEFKNIDKYLGSYLVVSKDNYIKWQTLEQVLETKKCTHCNQDFKPDSRGGCYSCGAQR